MPQPTAGMNPAQITTPHHDASVIDPATHTRLASTNSGKCWLCGLRGKHASRVIDTPDLPLLHEFQRRLITQLTDLNGLDNLVFLCTACHDAFTDPAVVWIFLPTSLDEHIAAEESFHARRRTSASRGEHLPRPTAAAAISPVRYSRYQILSGYLFTHIFTDTPTQMWSGTPITAVIRSARVMAGFESLPVEDGGLPMDVALKLQRLLLLYGAPEPRLVEQGALGTGGRRDSGQPQNQVVLQVRRGIERPVQHVPEELVFYSNPELASVGRAFSSALDYVQHHSVQTNLSSDAQAWMMNESRSVMSKLKKELHELSNNKDNPLLLPEYAVNRDATLLMLSSKIPHVLERYSTQFEACLVNLFNACGLGVRCSLIPGAQLALLCYITFPEGVPTGSQLFDPEFENAFVSGVQAITF